MLRYKRQLLWLAVMMLLASALLVIDVEVTYERNVRHIPAHFQIQHRPPAQLWRA
jgi:hypothetical protein